MKKINLLVIGSMLFSTAILGPVQAFADNTSESSQIRSESTEQLETSSSLMEQIKLPEMTTESVAESSDKIHDSEADLETEETDSLRSFKVVSTFTDLLTALKTPSVTEIQLAGDIEATSHITSIPVRDIVINGEGNVLEMGLFAFNGFSAGSGSLTFKNMTLLGRSGVDPVAFLTNEAWNFHFENVELKAFRIDAAKANFFFEGTNTNIQTLAIPGNRNAINVNNFSINPNSSLEMTFPSPTGGNILQGANRLTVGKNAQLKIGKNITSGALTESKVISGFTSIRVLEAAQLIMRVDDTAIVGVGLDMQVAKEAVVDIHSKKHGIHTMTSSTYNFEPSSTFIVKTDVSYPIFSTVTGTSSFIFNKLKKLEIENLTAKPARAIHSSSQGGTAIVELQIIEMDTSAWTLATNSTAAPTYIWENLEFHGRLVNMTMKVLNSNNADATKQFDFNTAKKINGVANGYVETVTVSLNEVTDKDTTVSGKATPNAAISLVVAGDTYQGKADAAGNYSINMGKTYPGKTVITATGSLNGVTGTGTTTIVDRTAPSAPTVNPLNDKSTQVTGKAEADSTVVVTVDGTELGRGKADSSGNYSIEIPAQKEGTTVSAEAIDDSGNQSGKTPVIVSGTTIAKPTLNPVTDQDTKVSGKAVANATITLTIPQAGGGSLIFTGQADGSGNYSIPISKQVAGTTIVAVATKDGKASEPVETTVQATTLADPTINKVSDQDISVTGKAPANSTVTLTIPKVAGGTTTYTGQANGNGEYSIGIPKQVGGTEITAVASQDGKTSNPVKVTVTDETAPDAPTMNGVTDESTKVTGKAEPNATVELTVNGVVIGKGTANSTGDYTITIQPQKVGTVIKGTATDKEGNKSQESSTTVKAVAKTGDLTSAADYQVKPTAAPYITGTFTGDVASLKTVVNTTEYQGGTLNADGTFTIYAWNRIHSINETVTVYAYDKYGNELDRINVKIVDNTGEGKGELTSTKDYVFGTDTVIEAAYTGPVAYINVVIDGQRFAGGTVNNGKITFYAWGKIVKVNANVMVEAYDKAGQLLDKRKVNVVAAATKGTITPDAFDVKTKTSVTGTYTGDVKKVNLIVDGTVYTGGSASEGKVSFYAWNKITSNSKVVVLVGLDASGKELDRKAVSLTQTVGQGTLKANTFTVGKDSSVTGTYTGDVKTVKLVVDGTSYAGGAVSAGNISFYAYDKIKSATKEVILEGYDAYGNKIASQVVAFGAPLAGKISVAEFTFGKDSTIKGTYTGDVFSLKTIIDGTELSGGTVAEGNLAIYVWGRIPTKTSTVEVVAYGKDGKELARQVVVIK